MNKEIDLIVKGGIILCMDEEMRNLENYEIAIDDGQIIDIYPAESREYIASRILDASDCIVLPGLINAHTHLPMTYFRGLADDLPLEIWLNHYIWPLEAKILNRNFIYNASLHGAAEMLKNGITQIHDMYFDMPAIADACTKVGLRAIIGEALLDGNTSSPEKLDKLGNKTLELKQRYNDNPLVDFNLAPHSIYGCSQKTLEKCAQVAADTGILLHMHLSETKSEVDQCIKEHGLRPVFYLKNLGILDLPAVYAHGVWIDEEEIELLSEVPASIAICTESNLKLASGILPLASYKKHKVNLCFATDGVASNNNLDILSEMDVTAKLHKVVNNDPAFLPAVDIVRMATCDAAKALGISDKRGSLTVGKDADICILSLSELECQPLYNPYSHIVYALSSKNVRDVVVNGKIVLENGKLTQVDESSLIATAKKQKEYILQQLSN
ncbi:MAG: amidohydrolase [Candidatus Syntrophosphaera sp.]|jgi:5-methylthioadenosine/S-adenosylhomocysteine deaminase|nr:amidohydrolase [Candidatus Syntrophosphaera sp.]